MKRIYILLLSMVFIFGACSKYDEGPFISLRLKKNRMDGEYTLKLYKVDGADSLSTSYARDFSCHIDKFGAGEIKGSIYDTLVNANFEWEFNDDRDEVRFRRRYDKTLPDSVHDYIDTLYYELFKMPLPDPIDTAGLDSDWSYWTGYSEILKLTDEEVWLEQSYNDKIYELHLKE